MIPQTKPKDLKNRRKTLSFCLIICVVISNVFTLNAQTKPYEKVDTVLSDSTNEKPRIAFSFDDGSTKDRLTYKVYTL